MPGLKKDKMGLIAQTKYGDCSVCPATNTNVVKRGKELFCLSCARTADVKKQSEKQRTKLAVRGLVTYQKVEGVIDSQQELIIDLDRVVSRYVRLATMDKEHKCQCFTCSTRKRWQDMQLGHFISRSHLGLRWESSNNKCQCPHCNVTLRGNLEVYAINLEAEQKGITEWLYEQSKQVYSPTRDELKQLLFDFQQKLKLVEKKLI